MDTNTTTTPSDLPEDLQLAIDLIAGERDSIWNAQCNSDGSTPPVIDAELKKHTSAIEAVEACHQRILALQHAYHQQREGSQARVDSAVVRALEAEKERDDLRKWKEEIEKQEPACKVLRRYIDGGLVLYQLSKNVTLDEKLYARPAVAEKAAPEGWWMLLAEAGDMIQRMPGYPAGADLCSRIDGMLRDAR
jgi:alpha-L-fucosidase